MDEDTSKKRGKAKSKSQDLDSTVSDELDTALKSPKIGRLLQKSINTSVQESSGESADEIDPTESRKRMKFTNERDDMGRPEICDSDREDGELQGNSQRQSQELPSNSGKENLESKTDDSGIIKLMYAKLQGETSLPTQTILNRLDQANGNLNMINDENEVPIESNE